MARFATALTTIAFILLAVAAPGQAGDRWTIIHAGRVLDVPGGRPRGKTSIIIKNERILALRKGFITGAPDASAKDASAKNPQIIDWSDKFVLPGLIDSHVHITVEISPHIRLDEVTLYDADRAFDAAVYARRTLAAGFTTVRDLGSRGYAAFALRNAIKAGKLPGPRLLVAGDMISPLGGHGDMTGYREGVFPGPLPNTCSGVADCRRAVRYEIKRGADVIKLSATGGVLSPIATGTEQEFFPDELRALVETGHLMGKRVSAHAHGTNGIKAALRAGVDSIEHGTFLDDEAIALFHDTGAWLVPTMLAGATVAKMAEIKGYFPPAIRDKARRVGPQMRDTVRRAYQAGVKIAFGTDSGVSKHGQNARELALMVAAGMPPAAVLKAATVNASQLLNRAQDIGTLEPGKYADLIATDGDPLEDITVLSGALAVMKGGVLYQP